MTERIKPGAPTQTYRRPEPEPEPGIDWPMILGAIRRRAWLIAAITVVGTAVGFLFARTLEPTYSAEARVWIEGTSGGGNVGGPIQTAQLMVSHDWEELLRSYRVLGEVVREQDLYLSVRSEDDEVLFDSFDIVEQGLEPGRYILRVDVTGEQYELVHDGPVGEVVVDSGWLGGPVGNGVGFVWQPPAAELAPEDEIVFRVQSIRDASRELADRLVSQMDERGNFMRIQLPGDDPVQVANTVNALLARFVSVAEDLKSGSLSERSDVLAEQLQSARADLQAAESALETFRRTTSTQPGGSGGSGGVPTAVSEDYFELLTERDLLARDRNALNRALETADRTGNFPVEAIEGIPAVQQSTELQTLLTELSEKRAEERDLLFRYNDTAPPVMQIRNEIDALDSVAIPNQTRALVRELDTRIQTLDAEVTSRSSTLESIPARLREERRLERDVDLAEDLYRTLEQRQQEARLAEVSSSIPDLEIFDPADPSRIPESQPGRWIMLLAFFGSLGVSTAGVVLLARTDHRLRFPSQITQGMGLTILGGIPRLKAGRRKSEVTVMEAFRSLRLNLDHAYGAAGPMVITITSPDAGDGKSFISANLASAFARQGRRTVVIDADTRRGTQHQLFDGERRPGLTDYLDGDVDADVLVQEAPGGKLGFIPSGTRSESSPELLSSPRMRELLSHLKSSCDVILVDTPPLRAGVDAYALGTVTGNLLFVMRTGSTDVDIAEANLGTLDQLPVRVLGAVLNDVSASDSHYGYYAPLDQYQIEAEGQKKVRGADRRLLVGTGTR